MNDLDEVAFVLQAHDKAVEEEARTAFPNADVEGSDNAVGGATIAIFVGLTHQVLRTVLSFINAREARLGPTTLRIGKDDITLSGYTADDAERLLNSPAVQQALARQRD
ncbi:hypothetical protein DXV76_03475 [Rhodobacteraceae bacterium CCMM004]|nr:hypothetical protein DXV76_03475 [Rhodobacteraceae bacterium CCMM004]